MPQEPPQGQADAQQENTHKEAPEMSQDPTWTETPEPPGPPPAAAPQERPKGEMKNIESKLGNYWNTSTGDKRITRGSPSYSCNKASTQDGEDIQVPAGEEGNPQEGIGQ